MNGRAPRDSGFSRLAIARAVILMAAGVAVTGAALERRAPDRSFPPPGPRDEALPPIAVEANVFRTRGAELAVAPDVAAPDRTHLRSMEFFRRLRAYPGAPPRIPHGLTDDEYRDVRCNICHEKGGWVARFGTWAPLTPHPEYASCTQCHVPFDELVGIAVPSTEDALICGQCHVDPDRRPQGWVANDWRTAEWPRSDLQVMPGSPHLVPHDMTARSNCLACHGGPAAVAEIRTEHPERTNCRQCHVPAAVDVTPFRPLGNEDGAEEPS